MRVPRPALAAALAAAVAGVALVAGLAGAGGDGKAAPAKPKYGARAAPLSRDHAYLREAPAPDYWALAPHYVGQRDGKSCSLASIAMLVNAARAGRDLGTEDALASQDAVLERSGSAEWRGDLGLTGVGVTLDELPGFAVKALAAYGVTAVATQVLHAEPLDDRLRKAVHDLLVENERSAKDFLVANFDQGEYTGDVSAGHMAPVAAYDEARRRVLILDPDREWFEPYWVPEETFIAGLATGDAVSKRARGLLRIWVAE